MSSKKAGERIGKELTFRLLSFIMRGKAATDEEITEHFIHDPYYRRRLYEIKRLGYVKESNNRYTVTAPGRKRLAEEEIWSLQIPTTPAWNGKWHMVLFDIPTTRKKYRDILRHRLMELGLVLYQNSVWVYPYPLQTEVSKIAQFYFLVPYVSFAVAEQLSGEKKLREKFNLS